MSKEVLYSLMHRTLIFVCTCFITLVIIELLKAAQATMNPDEIDRIYRELWPIFQADLPITGIHPWVYTTVAHRRVRGLSTPHRASPFHGIDDLWLEDER